MAGVLEGTVETKVRPAVVIASSAYLRERPDVLVGILTTRPPAPPASLIIALETGNLLGSGRNLTFARMC